MPRRSLSNAELTRINQRLQRRGRPSIDRLRGERLLNNHSSFAARRRSWWARKIQGQPEYYYDPFDDDSIDLFVNLVVTNYGGYFDGGLTVIATPGADQVQVDQGPGPGWVQDPFAQPGSDLDQDAPESPVYSPNVQPPAYQPDPPPYFPPPPTYDSPPPSDSPPPPDYDSPPPSYSPPPPDYSSPPPSYDSSPPPSSFGC